MLKIQYSMGLGTKTVKILLTNDDGIEAPGLDAMVRILGQDHKITVAAPNREQSALSQGFSFHVDYGVEETGDRRFRVGGTPVDCVMFALSQFDGFDVVISGINRGANIAWDTWYSGTIGAACEAARRGVKAIAVSLNTVGHLAEHHYDEAARTLRRYIERSLLDVIPLGQVLNVNFPNIVELMNSSPQWARPGHYAYSLNQLLTRPENPGRWRVQVMQLETYRDPDCETDGQLIRSGPTFSLLRIAWPEPDETDAHAVKKWLSQL